MSEKTTHDIFVTLGASNHIEDERQKDDYYATDPKALELLLEKETFSPRIWECACGEGHLSQVLENHGYKVVSSDLIYRGYGIKESIDFLNSEYKQFDGDIITNPPYKIATKFVKKAIDTVVEGRKVAMFLKVLFLETIERRKLFEEHPPKVVYVFSKRIACAKDGKFDEKPQSAIAYAWFVWEKGFKGDPIIKWL